MNDNPFTRVVLEAGLITQAQLDELRRFKPPNIGPDDQVKDPMELTKAVALLQDTLESSGLVIMRETDLAIVKQYTDTAAPGLLHIRVPDGDSVDIEVTYGMTPLGEYIIPWKSESIADVMLSDDTHLIPGTDQDIPVVVNFKDVREVFFGQQKAFMVCKPRDRG